MNVNILSKAAAFDEMANGEWGAQTRTDAHEALRGVTTNILPVPTEGHDWEGYPGGCHRMSCSEGCSPPDWDLELLIELTRKSMNLKESWDPRRTEDYLSFTRKMSIEDKDRYGCELAFVSKAFYKLKAEEFLLRMSEIPLKARLLIYLQFKEVIPRDEYSIQKELNA